MSNGGIDANKRMSFMLLPPQIVRLFSRISLKAVMRCLVAALLAVTGAEAADLTWNGGNGTWDTITANWWDGAQNVVWPSGANAIFSGPAGTLTSTFPGPTVSAITFNTQGYVIQSGWINASTSSGLTITTNANATISSTLSNSSPTSNRLDKNGTGTLTVAGTNFIGNVRINAGEYFVGGSSTLFFSNVTLADVPGTVLTLGQSSGSTDIKSLSGGGIVQPDTQARTVKATLWDSGTFGGIVQDNGSGKLAVNLFAAGKTVELTNANTYSGATTVGFGTLLLSGNGSALNSAVTVSNSGTLALDNSETINANRLSDSAAFTMQGGALQFTGHSTTAVEENLGALNFSGAAGIAVSQPGGAAALLTFSGATRASHGSLDVTGNGRMKWTGLANGSTGIVEPYVTDGNEWATVGADARIEPYAAYVSDINTATATDHVKVTASGITSLAASSIRASVNMQNSSGGTNTLDLNGGSLNLTTGGLLSSGNGPQRIQNGTLSAPGEMVITNRNDLTIASNISETMPGSGLTKTGEATLTLGGNNSYTGVTAINQGALAVSSDANLGGGSTVEFNGGSLMATASFVSGKGLATGTPRSGTIDTNGFDVSFAGANAGAVSKTGAGTLTLSHPVTGSTRVSAGTLVLSNAASGSTDLSGGILVASGTLSDLTLSNSSTLDIGGSRVANLTTGSFRTSRAASPILTINVGVGSGGNDLWTITSSFAFPPMLVTGGFLFRFEDLGGVQTGIDYTLISMPNNFSAPSSSLFGFAPGAASQGWSGAFTTSSNSVRVNFTSVPEPETVALLLGGFALLRIFHHRSGSTGTGSHRRS